MWISRVAKKIRGVKAGIRSKLIALFVLIKVLPLILLAWFAWDEARSLGQLFLGQVKHISSLVHQGVDTIGRIAVSDSVKALDARAREDIERMTTDTAQRIAQFLYARDSDIRFLASLRPDPEAYRKFLDNRRSTLIDHGEWQLAPDQRSWGPKVAARPGTPIEFGVNENTREFNYRPPDRFAAVDARPLYLEISYLDTQGKELVKISALDGETPTLRDVSQARNTYVRAERYFEHLGQLRPGEIYVSDVIGAYVPSRVIGPYTPDAARKAGVAFRPEASAYAGKENPKGRRFRGIVRWAMPRVEQGKTVGYVTLALDHDHLMEFTDHLVPTAERYSDIPDASTGNYAFIWDYKGRNIAHPRHYFIAGYDPATGDPSPSWLDEGMYRRWQRTGQSFREFSRNVPSFLAQGLDKTASEAQVRLGQLGLDCRYLNFAPQCKGWFDVTSRGGSGSFLILWSGLWKLTTAAAIPYYTGPYAKSPRGFGFVTIGANVDEFHAPANATKGKIDDTIRLFNRDIEAVSATTMASVGDSLRHTAVSLSASTALMILIVVFIAIWMASYLTRRITSLVDGIARFRRGELAFRFRHPAKDEMSELASSFDRMADDISLQLERQEQEIEERTRTENELLAIRNNLEQLVGQRTEALLHVNSRLQIEISERRLAEQKALHVAEHDPLTGLANRSLFKNDLVQAIEHAVHHNKMVAVLFFDLDKFKDINDTQGHSVGDQLLCGVARIIAACVRPMDTVARLGGDEFAVIVSQIDTPEQAERIAQSILQRLQVPIRTDNDSFSIATSIGISLASRRNVDAEVLVQQADVAMYQAKHQGGNCYRFFADDMQRLIRERNELEVDLRTALREQQFCLYYQARYDTMTGRLVGVEALLRWQHPERGLLAPGAFLDVAALSGLLPRIDAWVLDAVCRQAQAWMAEGFDFGRVALNVSPSDLIKPDYAANFLGKISEYGLLPECVEVEITENALIRKYDIAVDNLRALRRNGCHIAIDDFGMEHSSLQRLIECPINVLKIDRFFVSRIGESKSEAVISAVVAMGYSIRLDLIAEGVETEAQLAFLSNLGCHVVQGYLFARPMPPDALSEGHSAIVARASR